MAQPRGGGEFDDRRRPVAIAEHREMRLDRLADRPGDARGDNAPAGDPRHRPGCSFATIGERQFGDLHPVRRGPRTVRNGRRHAFGVQAFLIARWRDQQPEHRPLLFVRARLRMRNHLAAGKLLQIK